MRLIERPVLGEKGDEHGRAENHGDEEDRDAEPHAIAMARVVPAVPFRGHRVRGSRALPTRDSP
jgi:hypothetical protein